MSTAQRRVALMLTTPGWRGSGESFGKIAHGLVRAGHQVEFIAGDPDVTAQLDSLGVQAHLVPTGDTGRREVRAVRGLFARQPPDVVLCDAPRDVRIARYASWPIRRAIVWRYNLHGRRLATDVLQRWLFGGLRHVAHLSEYGAQRLRNESPWLVRIPATTIPNGFDVDRLRPDPARGAAFRQAHGIEAGALVVATPTASLREKAVPVAHAAVEQLSRERDVTWVVADRAAPPSAGRLTVVPVGRLPQPALHDLMRAADLVLLPAPAELFGNVTAEAMALGAVVVGADAGATPEVVGDAGALFRAGDAPDAAARMSALLGDPRRMQALGDAARERIATHFPLRAMEEGFGALVRTV